MKIINARKRKIRKQIKKIYYDSFPKKERMPFWLMIIMSYLWNTKFLAFYENDEPCGFVYLANLLHQSFIMFFAVDKRLRNKGYGGNILFENKKNTPKTQIIVSIEHQKMPKMIYVKKKKSILENGFNDRYEISWN